MRVLIDPNTYPKITAALKKVGAEIVNSVEQAEALVYPVPGVDKFPPNIAWVQFPSAGLNHHFAAGTITAERRWSNASGAFGQQVAESAIALLLGLLHMHPTMVRADSWSPIELVDAHTRWLNNSTIAIIGTGGIAKSLATMLRPFGARSLALSRTGNPAPEFDEVLPITQLHDALPQVDHVILAVPLTTATQGLFSDREFYAMKPSATIINVARGEVIDTAALIRALDSAEIAGAGLDVTDPEPLPDGHPLWGRTNVLITPHTANTVTSTDAFLADIVAENYVRFINGERMLTEVDVDKGY